MGIQIVNHAQSKNFTKQQFHNLILQTFDDLFSGMKVEKLDNYFTEDFLILEQGVIWNKDTVVNLLQRMLKSDQKRTRINRINVVEFEHKGKTAWGSYWNEADIITNDGPVRKIKWLESAVLVRQKGQWKIKLLHSTRL
jgi:hypothetical protein